MRILSQLQNPRNSAGYFSFRRLRVWFCETNRAEWNIFSIQSQMCVVVGVVLRFKAILRADFEGLMGDFAAGLELGWQIFGF